MSNRGVFEREFRISSYEINPRGFARLTSIANYLQETAYEHATELGWGYHALMEQKVGWVLSRMRIKVYKYPVWDDVVVIKTWPRGIEKLFAFRDFQLFNPRKELLAEASTNWLIVNLETHRPQRMPSAFMKIITHSEAVFDRPLEKIPLTKGASECSSHLVKYSDLDIVGHVNNVKYIEWCADTLDSDLLLQSGIRDFEINFMKEARQGDNIEIVCTPSKGGTYLIEGVHSEDGGECFRTRLNL